MKNNIIRYELINFEPIRIADDSTSQSGQTRTLKYITGSAIRGVIIGKISKKPGFEKIKKVLFSDKIRFLNAYLSKNGKELLPSPKGFYENKEKTEGKKIIQNVLKDNDVIEGWKRASLGDFCELKDEIINYYMVDTGSDLKIKINPEDSNDKQNVFRNEYISSGNKFIGYIVVEDEALKLEIMEALSETILIGNARNNGMGKCSIVKKECIDIEQSIFCASLPNQEINDCCYMMLYSNSVMRDKWGEYCGIDSDILKSKLGVDKLEIQACATTACTVRGYNRTLKIKIPSVPMYEMGSVFRLEYEGNTITREAMKNLMIQGIGVRKNEGFGQVVFFNKNDYEKIRYKQEKFINEKIVNEVDFSDESDSTLMVAAKNYYHLLIKQGLEKRIIDGIDKKDVNNSQIGNIEALIIANRYEPQKAKKIIEDYFSNTEEREGKQNIQKKKANTTQIRSNITKILNSPIEKLVDISKESIMGFSPEELITEVEKERIKLDYLINLIRYENRKEIQ